MSGQAQILNTLICRYFISADISVPALLLLTGFWVKMETHMSETLFGITNSVLTDKQFLIKGQLEWPKTGIFAVFGMKIETTSWAFLMVSFTGSDKTIFWGPKKYISRSRQAVIKLWPF
jgi:hypothetical protein